MNEEQTRWIDGRIATLVCALLAACAPALAGDDDGAALTAAAAVGAGEAAVFVTARPAPGRNATYALASVNARRLRCADAREPTVCPTATLDFAPSGLDAESVDALRARLRRPETARGVVLRGRVRWPAAARGASVRFEVDAAWIAPRTPAASSPLYVISTHGTRCAFQPCSPLGAQRANSAATRTVRALELRAAPGEVEEHDQAWVDATAETGLLARGDFVQAADGSASDFAVREYYLRVLPRAGCRCGAALGALVRAASDRVLYPSESDRPIEFFFRPAAGKGALTPALVLALTGQPPTTPVEVRDVGSFFAARSAPAPERDPVAESLAAHYRVLQRVLTSSLRAPRVFRTGVVEMGVYVLGRDACGQVVGVQTTVVET